MEKEKVKLDEVLKFLFSTSNKVLVKLLNGIFNENFSVDEVELTVSNNEFVEDDLGILRGDMFFDILNKDYNKASYHIEFQTKNDNTMIVRMFEYGFKKGKEQLKSFKNYTEDIRTIYFPKQKVIFFEENKNIKNQLKLKIIFPDEKEIIYTVDVMKYWDYSDEQLREKKMYPLIPLQLFKLRKELEKAHNKKDLNRIKELSNNAKELAGKLAKQSAILFEDDEILGEDFHKMLLAIQNLIEYLNRNYMNDENIENEVTTMTKTLYDPEVEKRGIEKGRGEGIEEGINLTKKVFKLASQGETIGNISKICKISEEKVKEILD